MYCRLHLVVLVALAVLAAASASRAGQEAATKPAAEPPSLRDARELWLSGEYEGAAEQYRSLRADEAKLVPASVGLARCLCMTGAYDEALAALDAAGGVADGVAEWHTMRAEVLSALGQYEEAIRQARQALEADPQHHAARLRLGTLLELTGRRDQAIEVYSFFDRLLTQRMPTTAEGIAAAAQGFYRYSVLTRHPNLTGRTSHVLQEMLQVTYERVDRNYWPARLAAADLLHSKYNNEEAAGDYEAALRINPNLADAHVGLGKIALDTWDFETVELHVDQALKINSKHVGALCLRAELRIIERRYEDAVQACEQALVINPNDVLALSLAASASRSMYRQEAADRYAGRAWEVNERCATLYRVLGDGFSGMRQYADAERAYLQSIEFEPTDANARTELGLMYMQWGKEDRAHEALEASWSLDPFNERTYNTLDLLKKLESFARLETDHFVILYDGALDWPVAQYLAEAAETIYDDVCAEYEIDIEQKTTVEIFPTQRDFAVRITGKPWIHTVGACTGWVIALGSPRKSSQTSGAYDYAGVLVHEFTHTVTLAATENRIAHWYTEGLAVSAENRPRSLAWKEILADAIRHDRLFTLESIDWGFIRPRRPNDRQQAYAQSEWMVEYIAQTQGYDVLTELLEAYRSGRSHRDVIPDTLGVSTDEFDTSFAHWARKEAEDWGLDLSPVGDPSKLRDKLKSEPDNAEHWGKLAIAELDAGNLKAASEAIEKALARDAEQIEALRASTRLLRQTLPALRSAAQRKEMVKQAEPRLLALAKLDPEDWISAALLAQHALTENRFDKAEEWLSRLQKLRPDHPAAYSGLSAIYLRREDDDKALATLSELARLDEHDADVSAELAKLHARADRLGEARYWYTRSLHIDPFKADTHRRLAQVLMRQGDPAAAAAEYEVLCRLEPDEAQHHADAAFAFRKAGDENRARELARRAVELDSHSPARALLGSEQE